MTKYWYPPLFSPKFIFTKTTQNGLKWILNITFKTLCFINLKYKFLKEFFTLLRIVEMDRTLHLEYLAL